jgi:hypothetical protein
MILGSSLRYHAEWPCLRREEEISSSSYMFTSNEKLGYLDIRVLVLTWR